jgi:putative ABC transport system permease protein
MVALMPSFYVPNEARIEINRQVMLFSLLISMLTGIIFGLVPALRSSRSDLTGALRESTRGAGKSARSERTRGLLVITEVALAVVLLVSATLTMRSFVALQNVTLGYKPDHILTADFPLMRERYPTVEQRNRFSRELIGRIKNTPGVLSATVGNGLTPINAGTFPYSIEGKATAERRQIDLRLASTDFLDTFKIPLKRGRMFTDKEIDTLTPVAVINEAAVGLWPAGQDPIGRRVRMNILAPAPPPVAPGVAPNAGTGATPAAPPDPNRITPDGAQPYVTVIGVIGNVRNDGIAREPVPEIVVPYSLVAPPNRQVAIRTQGEPKAFMAVLRDQIAQMDKVQPIGRPGTVEEELGFQSAQAKFVMSLFAIFAAIGLCLAAAGIYSVLSYLVTERTHEIGVRMALGAARSGILWLVVRRGLVLTLIGIAIGLAGSLALNRLIASQLVGITATDPLTFLAVAVVLTLVAIAACLLPAQRAARVDPMVALRYE